MNPTNRQRRDQQSRHNPIGGHGKKSLKHLLFLVGISTAIGMAYHAFTEDGLLANSEAINHVVRSNQITFLHKLDRDEFRRAAKDDETIVIDARLAADFESDHVPRAINLPITARSPDERAAVLADVPKSARIVIYCQSIGCPYDENVARRLVDDGYTNVALFPGGWQEWLSDE